MAIADHTRLQKILLLTGWGCLLFAALFNVPLLELIKGRPILFPNTYLIGSIEVMVALLGILLLLSRSFGWILRMLAGFFGVIFFMACTELGSHLISHAPAPVDSYDAPMNMPDSALGYRLRPDLDIHACRTLRGDTVFYVRYQSDSAGRRVVPPDDTMQRDRFIAFFGCSRTFGHGLNEDETLPYFAQQDLKNYRAYNYAMEGYGTHQVYAQIAQGRLRKEIKEFSGIGIYGFSSDHIARNIGSLGVYNSWGKDMPYYVLSGDTVLRRGTFTTGRRWRSFVYQMLWRSHFLRSIHFSLPIRLSQEDLELTVRLIVQSEKEFKRQFPTSDFYVVMLPSQHGLQVIRSMLVHRGIRVIDLTGIYAERDTAYFIKNDGHPSRLATGKMARAISDSLAR